MNRVELATAIKDKSQTNLSQKQAEEAISLFAGEVIEAVKKNDPVTLVGFGTFKSTDRAGRVGRNPKTGETINIPAKKTPKFIPGKGFKEALN
jgi:nucleoid DNA-binding protein